MRRLCTSFLLFCLVLLVFCCMFLSQHKVVAQNQTSNATTDPGEAAALNSVFQKWGISAPEQWNISGELCSGAAVGASPHIDDPSYKALIKCDCSYSSGILCHIVELRVNDLNIEGEIPEELWTLTYLSNLNLGLNSLTGPLSESIGNLTRMQWLNFGVNSLSGELPKSLGLLTDLRSFGFGFNNFSGPLPPELGSCTKLGQMYFESAGISGEIPATFANLTEMFILAAPDNNLTGRIPDFIGNWLNLQSLRLEGNSFEGPIPSTFSNLTSMLQLRLSDLISGNSSLEFIKNMKSLTTLVLRNDNLFGSIPSDISEYTNLTMLDLSFNNLTGEIPASLFGLSSLSYLFLGNNNLRGSLPTQKSSSLLNIDVSYNNFTGSIPSWISEDKLQLNLVHNNFTIVDSNRRYGNVVDFYWPDYNLIAMPSFIRLLVLPSGLNCLQRGFPCNRESPIYSEFAIKCGGPEARSSASILYESDNDPLGPATYYVASSQRWAVSNVGYSTGSTNPQYIASTASEISNSLDPTMFQTSRLSASSLRYYGLGLENGNYTVNLQFAEIVIPALNWWSRGQRLFDVYIQGHRVASDFDIKRRAGGSYQVVQMNFTAQVTENYLEIHFFWSGKGTCCIPIRGTYGPSISAISATPNFTPTVSNQPPSNKKDETGLVVGIVVGVGLMFLLFASVIFIVVRRKRRQKALEDEEFLGIDTKPYTFHYSELKAATEDFNHANKLGEGGFGPVYKGKLNDGRVIAVKQLSGKSLQGKSQFVTEIATISAVQHRNLVKLYGCCIEEDNRMLVYEYLENKSLDQALFGQTSINLDWPTRLDICLGVAKGLAYLHEESRLRIVHRDVKASNILLDSDLVPKISDFGLAKLYDDKKTHISTRVAGTIGYLAPEYAMRGHLTEKADVFAFGVVALEVVSGRPNSYSSSVDETFYLLEWAWYLHENDRLVELVDSRVSEFDEEEVKRLIGVALLCTQTNPMIRPSMSRAISMISGDIEVSAVTSKPGYLTEWTFCDINSYTSDNQSLQTDTTASQFASSISTNTVISPTDTTKPMLNEISGE